MKLTEKNRKIIGFSGSSGHGKTTTAKICKEIIYRYTGENWQIVNFSNAVKEIANILLDNNNTLTLWDNQNFKDQKNKFNITNRDLLKKIAEPLKKEINYDIWVNVLFNKYKNQNLIIGDVRFINEKLEIKKNGIIINISKDKYRNQANINDYHPDYFLCDYNILNTSNIKTLKSKLKVVLKQENII